MDKGKILDLAKEVLQGVDLNEVNDITITTGKYIDGSSYTSINIDYIEPEEVAKKLYADGKEEVIK